ncbi:MAG: sigma-70 family RNA polymerase sigma factor [Vicinamibacterales bacterium]|nr:sigma-70 family RNA polymerase sigma factor [Vicinamibacterales bacterium]
MFGRRRSAPPADGFAGDALEHLDSLYGTALRLARDADAAQDLVQETFLKAFRAEARFAAGTNLKAWLFTILHNTWRNRRRDRARSRVDFDSEAVDLAAEGAGTAPPMAASPEEALLVGVMDEDLRAALEALPEAFREAVWMRDVEELSYQEIAEALAVPIGTVMSRISRGRKQLYASLTAARGAAGAQPMRPGDV